MLARWILIYDSGINIHDANFNESQFHNAIIYRKFIIFFKIFIITE